MSIQLRECDDKSNSKCPKCHGGKNYSTHPTIFSKNGEVFYCPLRMKVVSDKSTSEWGLIEFGIYADYWKDSDWHNVK